MAKPTATIAIITRTKNRPLTLKRAVESVLAQTRRDFIHVIVNDGGESHVVERLLQPYLPRYEGRLLVIHHAVSKGMEAASNAGITACDSIYIAIHDDDDSWHPEFLAKTVRYLENEGMKGVLTDFDRVIERLSADNITELTRENCRSWVKELTLWNMCKGNFFPPIALLYKREVYDIIGGMYDETLPVLGDWEFNLRFLQHFDIGYLQEVLAFYHTRVEQDAVYGNTITSGIDKHTHYNKVLRNRLLRKDLQNNTLGIGYMLNDLHDKKLEETRQAERQMQARIIRWMERYPVIAKPARAGRRFMRRVL